MKVGDTLYKVTREYGDHRLAVGLVVQPPGQTEPLVLHWNSAWVATGTNGWHATREDAIRPWRDELDAFYRRQTADLNALAKEDQPLAPNFSNGTNSP